MNGSTSPLPISQDFIELCYRFSQLVNPCMHLQRSLQQSLPSLRFWCLGIPGDDFGTFGWWDSSVTSGVFRGLPAERTRPERARARSDYDTVKVYNRKITIDAWHILASLSFDALRTPPDKRIQEHRQRLVQKWVKL